MGLLNPESGAALSLLGAGLLQGNFGGGLAAASQYASALPEQKLRRGLLEQQIAETQAQAQERAMRLAAMQRQQEFDQHFFGVGGGSPSPAAGGTPTSAAGAGPAAPGGGFTAQQISAQFGVPIEAVIADYKFNGGKKIAELIESRSKPNWQNINGNLVNTNAPGFQGGFQPGMSASNDGRVTMWQPDGQGGLVVGAPRGAMETYGAYQNIGERSKADFDPVPVIGPGGATYHVPRSRVVGQGGGQPQGGAQRPSVVGSADADRFAILMQELSKAKASGNARDVAALEAEISRLPASARTGTNPSGLAVPGFQATPTTQQATQAEVDRQAALDRQKNIGEQRKSIVDAGFVAPQNISRYQQIGRLLQDVDGGKLTPVGTEFASSLNSIGIKVDRNLSNKEAAAAFANQAALELRNPQGGAGMPGALSDSDRNFLVSMTPNMAQSAQGRKMVIDAYVAIQHRNMQVADFARKYEAKYGKLDNGFFDQLQQWSNANPIFRTQ